MKLHPKDTIAAIATPLGEGGLAIIRISGPAAVTIADKVFRGKKPLRDAPGFTVHYGTIHTTRNEMVDQVLATVFRAPHSYTGEDAVEFSCHGGMLVAHRVLESVLETGARQSEPGEYTKRAFLNGRMDLSQAEAVADLIAARSHRAHLSSLEQLEGRLAGRIAELKKKLMDLCSLLEVDLDFSEEGIELISKESIAAKIEDSVDTINRMVASFEIGRVYREGVTVALVGRPNAGKSSIFNVLLQESRAIVTPVPGTTRDLLEENLVIGGILFRISDTAGLRESTDIVETEGLKRSMAALRRGDILVLVVDATVGLPLAVCLSDLGEVLPGQRVVVAYNKTDLLGEDSTGPADFTAQGIQGMAVRVSAKNGQGIDTLRRCLVGLAVGPNRGQEESLYITNRRHWESLKKAKASLELALHSLDIGRTNEFVAFDVREAMEFLAEITGEVTSEDVINNIFSRFCVGK